MTSATPVGRGLPAWGLRVATLGVVAAIVALLAGRGTGTVLLVIIASVGALAAVLPGSPAPALLIVGTAVLVAIDGGDPLRPGVLALVPLAHLVHLTCAYAAVIPVTARMHPAAFRAPAVRFVAVQAGVFVLAGVVALMPTGAVPAPLEIAALLGAVLLVVLIVLIMNRPQ